MAPAAVMNATWLYYALRTIAQCAAALAALIGVFGLWRQDRLRERWDAVDQDIERLNKERGDLIFRHLAADARDRAYLERLSRFDQRIQRATTHRTELWAEQQRLMDVLVHFLAGTLALFAMAIVGLAFRGTPHLGVADASVYYGGQSLARRRAGLCHPPRGRSCKGHAATVVAPRVPDPAPLEACENVARLRAHRRTASRPMAAPAQGCRYASGYSDWSA
jgi:hypothetical protein